MLDYNKLEDLINQYNCSITQSEAEVRSKFIVPLIEWLGYPIENRAEEFPIYPYDSDKRMPTRNIDFLLFDDKNFAVHRGKTDKDIQWVHDHSLLVFEAKKEGEMPDVFSQPEYYTIFSKATAYLISDGKKILGRIYNHSRSDTTIVNCDVNSLPQMGELSVFSYQSTLELKKQYAKQAEAKVDEIINKSKATDTCNTAFFDYSELVPDAMINDMKKILGKSARKLSKRQVLDQYFSKVGPLLPGQFDKKASKSLLSNPQGEYQATLYIDNTIFPFMSGMVSIYRYNEYKRIVFNNSSLALDLLYKRSTIQAALLPYHIMDHSVSARLNNFERMKRIHDAETITISYVDAEHNPQKTVFPIKKYLKGNPQLQLETDFWINGLTKMKLIEEHYNIEFNLGPVDPEKTMDLYTNVDYVYRGIAMLPNCHRIIPDIDLEEDLIIDSPELVESGNISIPTLKIHNYTFKAEKIYLPACKIKAGKSPISVAMCAVLKPVKRSKLWS